ncbi:MAG: thermosome subunit beta, partial [Candidatus Bathyarchaeia archaeon]
KAAEEILALINKLALAVDVNDRAVLKNAITTCMRGKVAAVARDKLAEVAIDAIRHVAEKRGNTWSVDIDHVQINKTPGKSLGETKLIRGLIIDKEVTHPAMPKRVEKPSILLLDRPLEIEKAEMNAEIRIRDPTQMKAFLDEESKMLKSMVDKIKAAGANLVICQRGIDDIVQHFLAREGIMAARRVKRSDVERLARACGGRVITNIDSLEAGDLGRAKLAEERKIGDDKLIFIEGCANPKSVGVLIRGGLQRFVDEAERALRDALHVIADIYECNKVVAGGGAFETELAKRLRWYAAKVGGKEQLAIESFANSLEIIPRTLAENAGLDPLDIIVALRASHDKSDGIWNGVDVFSGKVRDMMKAGVIEPLRVKEQAIKSAVEVASMILRIDDSIVASKSEQPNRQKG